MDIEICLFQQIVTKSNETEAKRDETETKSGETEQIVAKGTLPYGNITKK